MARLILGPALRHVGETTATFWVETDAPCTVRVLDHETRTFHVAGHHYALVVVRGLHAGECREYDVALDGEVHWPDPALGLPPSVVRTTRPRGSSVDRPLRILFGSCRTAAPHEPPWTLQLARDSRGRGVDAYHAHARGLAAKPVDDWPDLMLWLGDQVYADDSSPAARSRIALRRDLDPAPPDLPPELVHDFEEFTWLYHESWSPPWERWLMSVLPSMMIFDDHEMIDDWNISDTWVTDIRREDWWLEHVLGGLTSYWIYQHLGNLSPDDIDDEGILAELLDADDGAPLLRRWALASERFTPVPGGYRFSVARDLGDAKVVIIDSRNGRVLEPGRRAMVDDAEWAWVAAQCDADVDHLIIGSSLPVFVPGGMHDLQRASEAVVDGAWGTHPFDVQRRSIEWLRRAIDLEDWPAFGRSFDALVELITRLGTRTDRKPPATISVLGGDIHFSYHATVRFPLTVGMRSRVHQLVSSPIRNALTPAERFGMRLAMSPLAAVVGRGLRRLAGLAPTPVHWDVDNGPVWDNCLGQLTMSGRAATAIIEQAQPDDDGGPELTVAFEVDLAAAPNSRPATSLVARGVSRSRAVGTALAGRTHAIVDRIVVTGRARAR